MMATSWIFPPFSVVKLRQCVLRGSPSRSGGSGFVFFGNITKYYMAVIKGNKELFVGIFGMP